MSDVLKEITPLSENDFLYIVERRKTEFTYPIHQHRELELNFIEGCEGLRRIVGDSIESTESYELVLIGGEELEHTWEQGTCVSPDIREITIQFSPEIFSEEQLSRNQFADIRAMLEQAEHGIQFSMASILKCYKIIDELPGMSDSFQQYLSFLQLMKILASGPYRVLASTSFASADIGRESRRITKVKQYIDDHYSEVISREFLANLVGMSPSAFSRFFKLHTGRTLSDYIVETRLGNAARKMIDTSRNISEICFECGFNNLSNFNRIFRDRRGMTPREFRSMYRKNKVIV